MRGRSAGLLLGWVALLAVGVANSAVGQEAQPGRPVKVAAICIGCGGEHETKLKLALDHLETAGKQGVDFACLPEEFAGFTAEPIPGPTTRAVAEMARKHGMYVICPIREQDGDKQYNTAVLLDREGKVVGRYRKVFVYWGEGLHPSREGVQAFETDFGRVSILTCFDVNFAELWHQADLLNVDVVFWPSAYGGGSPLNAYATAYNYYVVPVGVRRSKRWRNRGRSRSSPRWTSTGRSSTPTSTRRRSSGCSKGTPAKWSRSTSSRWNRGTCCGRSSPGSASASCAQAVRHRDVARVPAPQPPGNQQGPGRRAENLASPRSAEPTRRVASNWSLGHASNARGPRRPALSDGRALRPGTVRDGAAWAQVVSPQEVCPLAISTRRSCRRRSRAAGGCDKAARIGPAGWAAGQGQFWDSCGPASPPYCVPTPVW